MESALSEIIVEILLDQNFAKPLDYIVPSHFKVSVGMRVEVPLKSKVKTGTIAKIKSKSTLKNLKSILKVISKKEELSSTQWQLAQWMSNYYLAPLQRVLKCFIPINVKKGVKEMTKTFLFLAKTHDETIKQIELLRAKRPLQAAALEQILNSPKGIYLSDLEGSKSAITTLIKNHWLKSKKVVLSEDLFDEEFFPSLPKQLNDEQKKCLQKIEKTIDAGGYHAHLIHGVTGSGKTEIFMQAIDRALKKNQSIIMLVPEVSLTSQTIERFKARFSEKIAILHHKRSLGERTSAWEDLKEGKAKLVIGARSALFCPAQNLGLIIVDEEHDGSYKQTEEPPCYHARDTAIMRAYFEKCNILLASATPSIESSYNAKIGKYELHTLKTRATNAPMPKIEIVDMVQEFERNKGFTHFSALVLSKIKERVEKGEQVLLFLNKRGYYRQQLCSKCRHVIKCPHCDLALTFHKDFAYLKCHLCDFQRQAPKHCPNCESIETLSFKGFGTEHVQKSLHAIFPDIRTLRMDRDTTTKKHSHEELFKQFRAHKADVLIGTQMIAKGFHFPSVTLACILNADSGLNIPDFRSTENVFQLITQVAGRAGRESLKGEMIIQTHIPDHPTIKLAKKQDYDTFFQSQIDERKTFCYPPFCHLVKLLFTDPDETQARKKAETAYQLLKSKNLKNIELLPVSPSGHAKIKDLYRFQFLVKVQKISQVAEPLKELEDAKIDVDPISTFF